MKSEELAEIETRVKRACPPPWDARCEMTIDNHARPRFVWSEYGWVAECKNISAIENADFIAHSITDVPALVAEVRRLRAVLYQITGSILYPDMTQPEMAAAMYRIHHLIEEALEK